MTGIIYSLNRLYAHAETDTGRVFIHAADCDFVFGDLQRGDIVEIGRVFDTPKGLRGANVSWVERPATGDVIEGTVTAVHVPRGMAFMKPDVGGPCVFLHVRDFRDYVEGQSAQFTRLAPGDRVRCHRVPALPNPRAQHIEIAG
jgi:cold shock CspA family protein